MPNPADRHLHAALTMFSAARAQLQLIRWHLARGEPDAADLDGALAELEGSLDRLLTGLRRLEDPRPVAGALPASSAWDRVSLN